MTDSAEKLLREIERGSYVRCERYGKTMPCGDCDSCKLKARIIAHLSAHPVTGEGEAIRRIQERQCTAPDKHGSACNCCQHHWTAIERAAPNSAASGMDEVET